MLKSSPANNSISICEQKCEFKEGDSSATAAKCLLPAVSTVYSDANFGISKSHKLSGFTITSTSPETQGALFDGDIHNTYIDSSSECHIQMTFKEGYVGAIDKVKVFFSGSINKINAFSDKLKFQSSDDGNTWTDIYTVDENVHTGWNYEEWTENQPKHQYYRFAGTGSQGCHLNEIELWGVETINDNVAGLTCSPKLTVNGVS